MNTLEPKQQAVFDNYFNNTIVKVGTNANTNGNIPQANVNLDSSSYTHRAKGNIDLEGFTDKLKELLDGAWEDDWGTFTMESPTGNDIDSANLPVITFNVVHRTPSKGKIGVKARVMESIEDPENSDYILILHRQWFDCVVEYLTFDCTNRCARHLADRFEMFMETYRGYFKEQGISEMLFQEEVDSKLSSKYKEGVPSNCLRYFMVLERILIERVYSTREMRLKIQASTSGHIKDAGIDFTSR